MAYVGFIGLNGWVEPLEPEYNVVMSGMTPDAMFSRYIDCQEECVEAELDLTHGDPDDETNVVRLIAKMNSVASVAFLPVPVLPFFPWKAPVL